MHNKPVFFISDLHLGAGPSDDFRRTFELHRFLDFARREASELVIVGDFLELLQSELTEIYLRHHELFTHLFAVAREIPVTYVIGNHDAAAAIDYSPDPAASFFFGSPIRVTPVYEHLELRIVAQHGHQFDRINRRRDLLDLAEGSTPGDRIARAVGHLEALISPDIDHWLERYLAHKNKLTSLQKQLAKLAGQVFPSSPIYLAQGGNDSEYLAGARDLLRSPRYSVAILGHTHRQLLHRFDPTKDGCSGIYANTGSWVGLDSVQSPAVYAAVSAESVQLIDAESFEILASMDRELAPISQAKKQKQEIRAA